MYHHVLYAHLMPIDSQTKSLAREPLAVHEETSDGTRHQKKCQKKIYIRNFLAAKTYFTKTLLHNFVNSVKKYLYKEAFRRQS